MSWNRAWCYVALVTLPFAIVIGWLGGVSGAANVLVFWLSGAALLYVGGKILMRWSTDPVHVMIGIATVASTWLSALVIDGLARVMVRIYREVGVDLPEPTFRVLDAVRSFVPWILAAALTLAIVAVAVRKSQYLVRVCAGAAVISAIALSLAALTLVILPSMRCGFEWPSLGAEVTGDTQQSRAHGSAQDCGGA